MTMAKPERIQREIDALLEKRRATALFLNTLSVRIMIQDYEEAIQAALDNIARIQQQASEAPALYERLTKRIKRLQRDKRIARHGGKLRRAAELKAKIAALEAELDEVE